jgi:hypothetical protein
MDPSSPLSAKKCLSAKILSLYTIHRKGGKFNAGQEGRRVGSKITLLHHFVHPAFFICAGGKGAISVAVRIWKPSTLAMTGHIPLPTHDPAPQEAEPFGVVIEKSKRRLTLKNIKTCKLEFVVGTFFGITLTKKNKTVLLSRQKR